MIIDLILDRRGNEREIIEEKTIPIATCPLSRFWMPYNAVYPDEPLEDGLKGKAIYTYKYTAKAMYDEVTEYGDVGTEIARALDMGTEAEVKRALCNYIDRNEYNPAIKDYINSVMWLEGMEE